MLSPRVLFALILGLSTCAGSAAVLVETNAFWSFFRGFSEASSPDATAWREPAFDASSWENGQSAFYYENQPDSPTAYTGNTVLSDMFTHYTCVFLRRTFVLSNPHDFAALQVVALSDDGFIAWINGVEVARFNMPLGNIPFDGVASPALPEPVPWYTNLLTQVESLLVPGTNVFAVQAFNSSIGSSSDFIIEPALYGTMDFGAPQLSFLYPSSGAVVAHLTSVEVAFDKAVGGVQAEDLLINGLPATNLTTITPSQYVFSFPEPATGTVQVAWAANQGITDLTSSSNAFGGGAWSYTHNPNLPAADVIISEFMASNGGKQTNSVHDELGNSPDWLELQNRTATDVSLSGWFLTDDATRPTKWQFPSTLLPANGYMLVMASSRDTNVAGQLHTNFKLSSSPSYLALLDSSTNVVSALAPTYPAQYQDISFGRDRADPSLVGYFTNATPGAPNATRGAGFAGSVLFSRLGGTFQTGFALTLSSDDTNSEIRYVVVTSNVPSGSTAITNVPTSTSPLYVGPLLITNTAQVRARAFPRQAGLFPGPIHTESFVSISAAAASFTSSLPIILLHNFAGGAVPSTYDQSAVVMIFEPAGGMASLTNPPTLVSRIGLNIRGSSSSGYPQSPFAVELWDDYNQDAKAEFLGMPAESDWVLYAQDPFDTSFLHNPLMHQLCRDAGRYSSRTRFAEVFVNTAGGQVAFSAPAGGDYFGLYTIEEKIKRGPDRVDITQLEQQNTTIPNVTGGYLLKIDRTDSDERNWTDPTLQTTIVFQDPKGPLMVSAGWQAQYQYLTTYFAQFAAALYGVSYTNPVTGYSAWIDVDAWIDHHIFNALAHNVDAFRLSGYFYKDRNEPITAGPLWDFDRALGTSGSGDTRAYNPRLWRVQATGDQGTDFFGDPNLLGVHWWQRLFTDPDFWQKWIDRWTDLRRGVLATNYLFATVDTLSSPIRAAQVREVQRWGSTGTAPGPRSGTITAANYSYTFPGTYQGELDFLKHWLADRTEFIDTNFLRAPSFSGNGGAITAGYSLTITAPTIESNTTTYYTLNGADPRLPGGGISSAAISNRAPIVLTLSANARVFARNYNPAHSNLTGGAVGGNPPISSRWSGPTVATFMTGTPPLVVTEIMFHPAAPASGPYNAEDFEFVELKNRSLQPVNLAGARFTNGIEFAFSVTNAITNLGPGQYVVLVRNPAAFASRYPGVTNVGGQYAGSLDNSGERLYLEGALKEPILDFHYRDDWQPTANGAGFSLVIRDENAALTAWTNAASWRASTFPGGSPGVADPAPITIPMILVNEALTHTDLPEHDSIELFNPAGSAANIGGWFLTDDHTKPVRYVIPTNTVVPAGGYLVFDDTQFGVGTNAFRFSSLGEEVYLFSGDGTNLTGYRHGFEFGAQANGVSFGRVVTSDGLQHFVTQKQNSLGAANAGPKVGPVVINEIMYAPAPFGLDADTLDEYVELRNISGQTAPLYDPIHATNSWKLDGGVQFTFPPAASLPPWSYLLVVGFDPAQDPVMLNWFRSRFGVGTNVPIFGPFTGHLNNGGDRVALYRPDSPQVASDPNAGFVPYILVEEVNYQNQAPWPAAADSTGNSLQRIASAAFGDEPANWAARLPTPGALGPDSASADTDHDGLPDEWELANGFDPNDPTGLNGPLGDADGDGASNYAEYIAGTDPHNNLDYLHFDQVSLSGAYLRLQFTPRAGRSYSIEQAGTLSGGAWTAIVTNLAGTDSLSYYDPLGATNHFYRLKVRLN